MDEMRAKLESSDSSFFFDFPSTKTPFENYNHDTNNKYLHWWTIKKMSLKLQYCDAQPGEFVPWSESCSDFFLLTHSNLFLFER
jgi:hypothetical protein